MYFFMGVTTPCSCSVSFSKRRAGFNFHMVYAARYVPFAGTIYSISHQCTMFRPAEEIALLLRATLVAFSSISFLCHSNNLIVKSSFLWTGCRILLYEDGYCRLRLTGKAHSSCGPGTQRRLFLIFVPVSFSCAPRSSHREILRRLGHAAGANFSDLRRALPRGEARRRPPTTVGRGEGVPHEARGEGTCCLLLCMRAENSSASFV